MYKFTYNLSIYYLLIYLSLIIYLSTHLSINTQKTTLVVAEEEKKEKNYEIQWAVVIWDMG